MALVCAISGELPQVPVISSKSGTVYERRLIEAYISEHASEPTTGTSLSVNELIAVRPSQSARPRAPELTSIPSLLVAFQQEWDALALQVYTLQQTLTQTRQELSTALYQNDAAVRVIARLTKERDDARQALSSIDVTSMRSHPKSANGDAMHVDNKSLPQHIAAKIDATQAQLMSTRRKRPIPVEWATAETISTYRVSSTVDVRCPGATFLRVNEAGTSALVGGKTGDVRIVNGGSDAVVDIASGGEPVTAGAWVGSRVAVGTASGKVKIFDGDQESMEFHPHAEDVTGLAVHPGGHLLASASLDKSYSIYDLESHTILTQVSTTSDLTCAAFHPDGHLLAVGTIDGQLQVFDVKSGVLGGAFELDGPATAVCFSENGTWVATASQDSSAVSIWNLRKTGAEALLYRLETGSHVTSLSWDYTAQFLAIGSLEGTAVKHYTKATKEWSEPFRTELSSRAVGWGDSAQSIFSLDNQGQVVTLSSG